MSLNLPVPIAAYFADNGQDRDAWAQYVADNAVVRDEGRTIRGLPAIKAWKAETKKQYQHTLEPLASVDRDGKIDVTVRVAGHFPGSPIDLQFIFSLEGGKISVLEIP